MPPATRRMTSPSAPRPRAPWSACRCTSSGPARWSGAWAVFDEDSGEPVARAALVLASAGIGKSRLRRDFLRRLRARSLEEHGGPEVQIWRGNGDLGRAGSPFGLVAAALRDAVGLAGGEE